MDEDECRHGLAFGTCGSCARSRPETSGFSAAEAGPIWEKYRNRYTQRPETFEAYVDVWKRSATAQAFTGGWTAFSRAANAEPAIDAAMVTHAEDLMRQFGYESGPKLHGAGRRWRRSDQ